MTAVLTFLLLHAAQMKSAQHPGVFQPFMQTSQENPQYYWYDGSGPCLKCDPSKIERFGRWEQSAPQPFPTAEIFPANISVEGTTIILKGFRCEAEAQDVLRCVKKGSQ